MSSLSEAMDRPVMTILPVSDSSLTRTRYSPSEATEVLTGLPVTLRDSRSEISSEERFW